MADFEYQGVDRSGKRVSGRISAESDGELRMVLRSQGVRPTRISRQDRGTAATISKVVAPGRASGAGKDTRLKLAQRILITRQLQVLVSSGIPLVQGLEILGDQSSDPVIGRLLTDIREKVSQGSFFWESLAAYPRSFSKIYIALVRAGESSGSLDITLKRLTRFLEDSERLRRMVVSALTYPAVISVVGIGVLGLMLTLVIPKFEEMLKSSGTELPLPTQIVVSTSHFVTGNLLQILVALVVGGFAAFRFFQTHEGKVLLDRTLFGIPVLGTVVQKGAIASFTRTLQTLLSAGVNLIDAVDIARSTVDNIVIAEAVAKVRGEVESGKSLSAVLTAIPVFPRMAVQMISVGETTGNLDKMLEKVADFYESEVESAVGTVGRLVEPLMLVVLGGAVAGMLVAMYLPMFKMAGSGGGM